MPTRPGAEVLASGLGAAVTDTLFNPLEMLKVRVQTSETTAPSAARAVYAKGGLWLLWSPGLQATWVRSFCVTGLRIGLYPTVKAITPLPARPFVPHRPKPGLPETSAPRRSSAPTRWDKSSLPALRPALCPPHWPTRSTWCGRGYTRRHPLQTHTDAHSHPHTPPTSLRGEAGCSEAGCAAVERGAPCGGVPPVQRPAPGRTADAVRLHRGRRALHCARRGRSRLALARAGRDGGAAGAALLGAAGLVRRPEAGGSGRRGDGGHSAARVLRRGQRLYRAALLHAGRRAEGGDATHASPARCPCPWLCPRLPRTAAACSRVWRPSPCSYLSFLCRR